MAGLAAFRVNGIAELRFIPAAERIQVIEQHRDAKPMRRIPLLASCAVGHLRGTSGDYRQIADELAT
jgi:hypothetical protein